MVLEERMKRAIARRRDEVFVRTDFAKMGSEAQVSRALRKLLSRGFIVKLGVGVYAKAKTSVLSGTAIPVKPVGVLAPIALRKLGVTVYPSQDVQAYNSGASTQIPAGNVLNTGNRRISRKLGFGKQTIVYEKNNQAISRAH
jgi:hypothetical protein